jgi:hypothetical protein
MGEQQARSIIWCARTPHFSPLSVAEAVQLIEEVGRHANGTGHSFVFVDTVDGYQAALQLDHISSVSVPREF